MEKQETIENNSKVYFNGSVWKTQSCGDIVVVAKLNKFYRDEKNKNNHFKYYLCAFEDGTLVECQTTAIRAGLVKNPNKKNVCGFGYIGQGKWKSRVKGIITKEYSVWKRMIERCYSEYKIYDDYIDIYVDERWLNFQFFCNDIVDIDGYSSWKSKKGWELDKDILCEKLKVSPKVYSKKTCCFIEKKENLREMQDRVKENYLTGLTYVGTRLEDGYSEEFSNQSDFARKWGLRQSGVWKCLKGKNKQHKGWAFREKE